MMTKKQKQLVNLFDELSEQDQHSLLSFAQFLHSQTERVTVNSNEPEQPVGIERPEQEKVVAAIKRLSANFPMINKSGVLDEAANLMTQHMLHGREAKEVIDELESVFQSHYEKYLADFQAEKAQESKQVD